MKLNFVLITAVIIFGAAVVSGQNISNSNEKLFEVESEKYTEEGLVALWSFDEINGSIVPDESGNNNHGEVIEAAQIYGLSGLALNFDGSNDEIIVGDDPSLNFDDTNTFSISLWIKRDRVTHDFEETLISKSITLLSMGYRLNIENNNTISFVVNTNGKVCEIFSNIGISDLLWHHIVAIWDKGTQSLYIDGVFDKSLYHGNYVVNYFFKPLEIGIHFGFFAPYDGSVDEIQIYDRALSNEEIIDLYEKPAGFTLKVFFGKISDLKTNIGNIMIFTAERIGVIEFLPFQFLQFFSGEKIKVSEDYYGLITPNFVFGLFKSKIFANN